MFRKAGNRRWERAVRNAGGGGNGNGHNGNGDGITITSASSGNNAENTTLSHALTASKSVSSWTIVGGADQARYEISGSTLRWASNGTKDFEAPNDADTNNTYIVTVRATRPSGVYAEQTITYTVTNVAEAANTLVYSAGNQTALNVTTETAVSFDTVNRGGGDGIYSAGTPTRLTVPTGWTKVRVSYGLILQDITTTRYTRSRIKKNGSTFVGDAGYVCELLSAPSSPFHNAMTGPINVSASDYFEVYLTTEVDTDTNIMANSWFSMDQVT